MNMRTVPSKRRRGARRAVVAVLALLAGLVVLAQPAAAETRCVVAENGDLIVQLQEDDGDTTVLTMRDDVLFVNGTRCGTPALPSSGQPNIAIIDLDGDAKTDKVEIDLAAGPWRVGSEAVFVNLILRGGEDGEPDEVTVSGTSGRDRFEPRGDFLIVYRLSGFYPGTEDSRQLFMYTQASQASAGGNTVYNAEYELKMKGGRDLFVMQPSAGGGWFGAKVVAKGGSGADNMIGGPGRDRMRGGKGDDMIEGNTGNDILRGNSGDDQIDGGRGNDFIHGGSGVDRLEGKRGNDEIVGGKGRDRAFGGSGSDFFKMNDGIKDYRTRGGKGSDTCRCDSNDRVSSTRKL